MNSAFGVDGGEAGLSRRSFLGAAAVGSLAVGMGGLLRPEQAWAGSQTGENEPHTGNNPYVKPPMVTESDLASNMKRVLVVTDYQVDFVDGGVLGTIEPAVAIEDALYDRIKEYQDAGNIVIYTMDTHPADLYPYTREATVNTLHCDPATEGWQVYGKCRELLTPERAILVKKGTYGSIQLPALLETIRSQGTDFEAIEVAGVSTTCRVLNNAVILYNAFPEVPIVLDIRTTASYTDERTRKQLEILESWGFTIRW